MGVFYELQQKIHRKKFYNVGHRQFCPNMKKITLDKVEQALTNMAPEMFVDEEVSKKASVALERMLELA